MRKAILEKFIFVLLAALCINSVIFYIASRNTILDTTRKDMLYTMEMIDRTLTMTGSVRTGAPMKTYSRKYQPYNADPYRWNGCI